MKNCIEDMMRINNGPAISYLVSRFGLKPEGVIPGSQTHYIQKAIEHGADTVVEKLLELNVDPNKTYGGKTPISYVLEEEKKILSEQNRSRAQQDKLDRLFLIAGALLNAGAQFVYRSNQYTLSPIVQMIRENQAKAI